MHLNVYIAKSGFCSRRNASLLIKEGKASVGGKIVREPWFDVKDGDRVRVGNKPVRLEKNVYVVFNKPRGVTTTLKDKFADKKVIDFMPSNIGRVYPVGRLDKFSRGLIILTNDGEFCHKLTHPKFETEKEYIVAVKGAADSSLPEKLKKGVHDEDGILKVRSAYVESSGTEKSVIKVIICEGKKRHLRRLFEKLGLIVTDLKRVRIGRLELSGLREGAFKFMNKETIYKLTLKGGRNGE